MADAICGECSKKKPYLLPEQKGLEDVSVNVEEKSGNDIVSYIKDRCYACSKEEYDEKNKTSGFMTVLAEFLKKNPQSICIVEEKIPRESFENLELPNSVFIQCDLTESNFAGSKLSNSIFLGSILNNSTFANSTLEHCCFLGVQANFSVFSNAKLREVLAGINNTTDDACPSKLLKRKPEYFEEERLREAWKNGPRRNIDHENNEPDSKWTSEFKEAVFTASDLTNAKFINVKIAGTGFDLTRLQNTDFSNARMEDCSFKGVSLGGASFKGAQLDRADFSSAFTPDPQYSEENPLNDKLINATSVNFVGTDLHGAIFTECYFLQSDFSEVNARRTNWEGTTFGPESKFSGDFSNARFRYCDFIGCNLGREENQQDSAVPVDLRDTDFSHAYFIEVQIYTSNMDTACLERARFENRQDAKERLENLKTTDARHRLMLDSLNILISEQRINSIYGSDDIEPPSAMQCNSTTFGEISLKNILFLTADFSNSSVSITNDSHCSFKSCNFENAMIEIPRPDIAISDQTSKDDIHSVTGGIFQICSFKNTIINKSTDNKYNTNRFAFDRCLFDSTAFWNFLGIEVAFIMCVFRQTDFEQFNHQDPKERRKSGLSKLVLHRCRLMDGQYFGYLDDYSKEDKSSNRWKTWEARQYVLGTIRGIVKETLKYSLDSRQYTSHLAEPNSLSDRQYLWNMFAGNFRALALTDLVSECIARVKQVDIFPYEPSHTLKAETLDWGKSAIKVLLLFVSCLVLSAFAASIATIYLNSFWQGGLAVVGFLVPLYYIYKFREWQTWRTRVGHAVYFYGEKIPHALMTWGIVILTFSLFYWSTAHIHDLIGNSINLSDVSENFRILQGKTNIFENGNGFLNGIYFSAVTFTTLGFGDLHPVGMAKFYAAMEACLGAVLMALFVLSVARRTAAR